MKSFFFAAAALSALIAGQAVVAEDADDKKCSAEAYFHKQEAYNTGIVFVHGKKSECVASLDVGSDFPKLTFAPPFVHFLQPTMSYTARSRLVSTTLMCRRSP